MATLTVSQSVKEALETIKRTVEHKSYDSVIRSLMLSSCSEKTWDGVDNDLVGEYEEWAKTRRSMTGSPRGEE